MLTDYQTEEPETGASNSSSQVPWNLSVLTLDVAFFSFGMAMLDQNTVLPVMMHHLGATDLFIGGFAALRFLAFSLPQLPVAWAMHGRSRQKPFLAVMAAITRLPLFTLPLFLLRANTESGSRIALAAAAALLIIWTMGDGLGYVPWMEIVARAFTNKTRGRFFAATQLCAGVGSAIIALKVVHRILQSSSLPYPSNYAVLTLISAAMFAVSLVGVLLIREPKRLHTRVSDEILPPVEYCRRLPTLLRANKIFSKLAIVQLLIGIGGAAAPFYVLYAAAHFHLNDSWSGTYQMAESLGVILCIPLWTWLSEKFGGAVAARGLALACFLTPLLAIFLGGTSPVIFGLVFLLMGGSLNWGLWIVLNHYLLTIVSEKERTVYIALLNLLALPYALYPFLGGLLTRNGHLISIGGIPFLFLITAVGTGLGFIWALSLPSKQMEH